MKRYLPSRRTSSNLPKTGSDQLINEFTAQAKAIMNELTAQFSKSLQEQASSFSRGGGDAEGTASTGTNTAGIIGKLLNTGARYLVSRPQVSQSSVETSRSVYAAQLSVSGSQAAAEAQQALGKGTKNL